jgi:unsaturated rhamnogalacturonyl hydrolase
MLQRCVLMALAAIASLPLQLTVAGTRHHTASHSRAEILAIGAKVADWQLAHLDNFDYIPANQFRRDAEAPRDWVQAAFYIGLAAFADTTRNVHYEDAILAHGEAEAWGFDARPRHADADATGAVWVWAAQRTHDPAKLGPIRARFDAVLADPSTVSLEFGSNDARCQERWCWSDALFMAPPTWIALSQACGDERYLAHADQEFWATTHYLYDPEEHLFFRDSRYFTQRDAAGRKIFWSRGNGWVFAGLARILSSLPTNYPSRPRYETLFKQMAARLLSLQGSEGYWPVSLLEPQNTPETSGTGFFVYGLAWGINHGLLPSADYRQAADRGWHALTSAVAPDGKLGWVQPIGAAPDRVGPEDTQLYGVGAFLLAASEMSALP